MPSNIQPDEGNHKEGSLPEIRLSKELKVADEQWVDRQEMPRPGNSYVEGNQDHLCDIQANTTQFTGIYDSWSPYHSEAEEGSDRDRPDGYYYPHVFDYPASVDEQWVDHQGMPRPGNSYVEGNQDHFYDIQQEVANTTQFTGIYDGWSPYHNEAEEGSDSDRPDGYYSPHVFDCPAFSNFNASIKEQGDWGDIEMEVEDWDLEPLFPGIDVEDFMDREKFSVPQPPSPCAPDNWTLLLTAYLQAAKHRGGRRDTDGELCQRRRRATDYRNYAPRAHEVSADIDKSLIIEPRTRSARRLKQQEAIILI
jgi:hypothetical protein